MSIPSLSRESSFSSVSSTEDPNKSSPSLCRISLPFKASSYGFDGYGGITIADESRIYYLQLNGNSGRNSSVIDLKNFSQPPILAPHRTGQLALYTPGSTGTMIMDISRPETSVTLKVPFTSPKSRFITSLDWSPLDKFVIAAGTLSGTVQLWDLRSPAIPIHHSPFASIPIQKLKFDPFSDHHVLATSQGDTVVVWDFRSTKTPLRSIVGSSCLESYVVDFDWYYHEQRNIFTVHQDGSCRVIGMDDQVVQNVSLDNDVFACISLPSAKRGGSPRMALSTDDGLAIINPDQSGESVLQHIQLDHSTDHLGFLKNSHLLLSCSSSDIYFQAIHGLSRSSNKYFSGDSGGDLSPRDLKKHSSTELIKNEDGFTSHRILLAQLARKLRRMYFDVRSDDLTLIVSRPVSTDEEEGTNILHISISCAETDELRWDYWWSRKKAYPIDIDDLLDVTITITTPIDEILEIFQQIRKRIEIECPTPTAFGEAVNSPFSPTCGICWSPRGDLYRFNSFRGLFPWPENREKLTMKNFLSLKNEMDNLSLANIGTHSGGDMNNPTSQLLRSDTSLFKLNRIVSFQEPLSLSKDEDEENSRDSEFDRRVSIDQCVQYVPATIFEQTVEDHWFSSIASVVHLEESDKSMIAQSVQKFTEQLMVHSNARLPKIVASWKLMDKLFSHPIITTTIRSSSSSSCGFQAIITSVFQDQLEHLYKEEQTQAVAILATIGNQLGLTLSENPTFHSSLGMVVHDHANLFQRLGNWKNARIMEKFSNLSSMMPESMRFEIDQKPKQPIVCCVCDIAVRGLVELCLSCGHGGHMNHMDKFFSFSKKCPYLNCECTCRDLT